jgi:CRISPR system Cascade subunit CasB
MSEHGEGRRWTVEAFFADLEARIRLADAPERRAGTSAARATLAALRRGAGKGPGEVPEVDRVLQTLLWGASEREERLAYVLGPLVALYVQGGAAAYEGAQPPRDLGASLAQLRRLREEDQRASGGAAEQQIDPTERRLMSLLASRADELPDQLRRLVLLLKAEEVGVNWRQLWWDLWQWDDPERPVQRRWARSFWRRERPAAAGSPDADGQRDRGGGYRPGRR